MVRLIALLCAAVVAAFASAQTAPLPPTPYELPVIGHVGRYLDSTATADRGGVPDTYRAGRLKVAPERDALYQFIGERMLVKQRLSTFVDRVVNEPLRVTAGAPPFYGEKYLAFEQMLDPYAPGSGWPPNSQAGALRLINFDWDDRGLDYLAFSSYWGIVDDGSFALVSVHADFVPLNVWSFRDGDRYYLIGGNIDENRLYDVTDPRAVTLVRSWRAGFIGQAARAANGTIALIHASELELHTGATLAAGSEPLQRIAQVEGSFVDVVTDGVNFYALEMTERQDFRAVLHVIQPAAGGYAATPHFSPQQLLPPLRYGAGYLTAVSMTEDFRDTYAIFAVAPPQLVLLDDTYLAWNNWLPGSPRGALPVLIGGRRYLITADWSLGDVYALAGPRRRSVR